MTMPANVLVVDDHQLYRETFCALLESCFPNLQIIPVEDGSRALSMIHQIAFDLLILDYHLKTISGGDVVRRLRAGASLTGCEAPPFILMSSHPDIAIFSRSLGAHAFLNKPVDARELEAAVGPVLDRLCFQNSTATMLR